MSDPCRLASALKEQTSINSDRKAQFRFLHFHTLFFYRSRHETPKQHNISIYAILLRLTSLAQSVQMHPYMPKR